jgi:uncharacterized protein (TIGR02099 family)
MLRRSAKFTYQTILYSVVTLLVLLALLLTVLRYLLPQLPDVTRQLEYLLAERYQVTASVAELSADWNRNGPQLVLRQLQLPGLAGETPLLVADEARIHFNFWQSLRSWSWQIERVTLDNAQFSYDLRHFKQANNRLAIKPLQQFLLQQLVHIDVRDSAITLTNLVGQQQRIIMDELRWFNYRDQHQGVGRFRIADLDANELDIQINLSSADDQGLSGQIYMHAEQVDIATWLQQQMVAIEVAKAQFNFDLWLNVEKGVFADGLLTLGDTSLHWQSAQQAHIMTIASGAARLRSQGDGWLVNSNPITVQHNDRSWQLPPLSIEQQPQQWQLSMQQLALAPLLRLLQPQLDDAALAGALSVKMRQALGEPLQWQLQGDQLSWPKLGWLPGLQAVNVSVVGQGDSAQWRISGEAVTLQSDAASLTSSWQLPQLAVMGDWQWHQGAWQLLIDQRSHVDLQGMKLGVSARLQKLDNDLFVAARAHTINQAPVTVDALRAYLPTVMGDQLHSYLNTALLAGEAEQIAMVWRGTLSEFPYAQQQGSFAAQANLNQVMLKFQPNWLPVYDADIALNFSNQRMHIVATNAALGQMQLPRIDTVISNIKAADAALQVSAQVTGLAQQLQPIFAQSPLAANVAESLQQVQPRGPITGVLALTIPLAAKSKVQAQGHIDFSDNALYLRPIDQTLSGFSGRLSFINEQLQARELTMQWQGLPLTANVSSANQADAYQLSADFTATWPIGQVPAHTQGLDQLLSGQLNWQSQLELRLPKGGDYALHWRQQVDLSELALNLPEPLSKPLNSAWPLQLQVSAGPEHILLNAELAERGLLELQLSGDGTELVQGYARLGEQASQTPQANMVRLKPTFAVDIHTDAIHLEQWLRSGNALAQWWQALDNSSTVAASEESTKAPQRPSLSPDLIQISSNQFDLYGYALGPSSAVLWPDNETGWRLDVEAENAAVTGHVFRNEQRLQLDLDAEFITLPAPTSDRVEEPAVGDFSQFPQLNLSCKRCRYGSYDLGNVQLQLSPAGRDLWLQQLTAQQGRHQLQASGYWRVEKPQTAAQTQLQGRFRSADLGAFLREHDITTMVQDSPADFTFDLNWQGSPFAYSSASLNGSMNWRLGQGYLNEVSDGAARIFSLLSLEGLIRKLRFDFRDVFANGLFYTEFGGEFSIDDGLVSTANTRLNGSAGDMEINGTVNLVSSELNYQIFYIPKVTSSLPVIVAWMVNPPSGLAALLIDRVLHDAQVISRLEYRITGTIEQPLVEEVARDSRDVEIPLQQLKPPQEQLNEQQQQPPAAATDSGAMKQ